MQPSCFYLAKSLTHSKPFAWLKDCKPLELQVDVTIWSISWHNIIDQMFTSGWCQIANIIWTSTREVNIMSSICLENYHWQTNLMNTNFGWKQTLFIFFYVIVHQFDANSWCQFDVDNWLHNTFHFWPMVDSQLTSIVGIIMMSIQHLLPTENAGGKMGALCVVE